MIRIPLKSLEKKAELRPRGYMEDCIAAGNICGDELVLEEKAWNRLCMKYRKPLPKLKQMLSDFGLAMLEWLDAGFAVVSKDEFEKRHSVCLQCDEWGGNRCTSCGCCEWKPWLLTAKCPKGKWPAIP